jgi:uncharacterized protein YjiS (DUF1127 family)
MAATNCDCNRIFDDGDDGVTARLQSFFREHLWENSMLKKRPSQSAATSIDQYNAPGDEQASVPLLHSDIDEFGSGSGHADGYPTQLSDRGVWSSIFTFLIEGFALYGAALHPCAAYRVDVFPAQQEVPPQKDLSSRQRRQSIPLVLPSTGRDLMAVKHDTDCLSEPSIESEAVPAGRPSRWNWLTLFWQAARALWTHWRRERKVKRAIDAVSELDNRTLRDIGIPHRSQIDKATRYGRDF